MRSKLRLFLLLVLLAMFAYSPGLTYAATGQSGVLDSMLVGIAVKLAPVCPDSNSPEAAIAGQEISACNTDPNSQDLGKLVGGDGVRNANSNSLTAQLSKYTMAMIYNPPVSTGTYVADLRQNLGVAPTAYAQGLGFGALSPVLEIWKVFRNISYMLIAIAFLVVGFAIIFRAKINPQTVISVQLALPRLVLTLLAITFSYAIAGLMIDIMYLSTFLLIGVFAATAFESSVPLTQAMFERSIIANVTHYLFGHDGASLSSLANAVSSIVASVLGYAPPDTLDPFQILTNILSGAAGLVAGVVFFIVFVIVILWKAFQIFFALLGSYVQVIFLVIFAPLRLLTFVIPGNDSFWAWLKELAANLAVFPVTGALFFVAMMLAGSAGVRDNIGYFSESGGFTAPLLGFTNAPDAIKGLIAIGILMTIPQILEQMKASFGGGGGGKGGGGGAFGGALGGAALGQLTGPISGIAKSGLAMGYETGFGRAGWSASDFRKGGARSKVFSGLVDKFFYGGPKS